MSAANTSETQTRVPIDEWLKKQGWSPADYNSVKMEFYLADGSFSDYMLKDRNESPIVTLRPQMLEAKKRERAEALKRVKELREEFGFTAGMLKGALVKGGKKK